MKVNFIIVDDEALIREGIKSLLLAEDFVGQIFEAESKNEFLSHLQKPIDIVLMDFKLGSSTALELLKIIKERQLKLKVIAVTGLEGTDLILNLLKAGVNGIVYKLDGYAQIRKTIEHVISGESYFSKSVLRIIKQNAHDWDVAPPVTLSFGERELLRAIASGLTTKEIASELHMTEATIETYRVRLIKKVNAQNTASLIAYGFKNGML